jgi:GTP-binding protein
MAVAYGLFNVQERGCLFIDAGVEVYEGMIVGENARSADITVNVCKKKHLTNTRSSSADEALRLTPPLLMSLEKSLEFINDDELLEVTPKSLRLRKMILDKDARAKADKNKNRAS